MDKRQKGGKAERRKGKVYSLGHDSHLTLDAFAEKASASKENVCKDFYPDDTFFDLPYAT